MSERLDSLSLVIGGGRGGPSGRKHAKIDVKIGAFGRSLRARVAVADSPVGLADLAPLARVLATELTGFAVQDARAKGLQVPCKKGCSACCRYMVPLSVPEAFRLWDEIASLPADRREDVLKPFADAGKSILAAFPRLSGALSSEAADEGGGRGAMGRWYAGLALDCPFLADNTCKIYTSRPVACREYAAAFAPGCCEDCHPGRGRVLGLPFSILTALTGLASEVEQTKPQAVILPMAPPWAAANRDRAERTWPGPWLVEQFLSVIEDLCLKWRPHARAGRATPETAA